MFYKRFCAYGLAGYCMYQLFKWKQACPFIYSILQPVNDIRKTTLLDIYTCCTVFFIQISKKLRCHYRSKGVTRKITERPMCPVNILQASLRVTLRPDPEETIHPVIPCFGYILNLQLVIK